MSASSPLLEEEEGEYAEFLRQQSNTPSCRKLSKRLAVYASVVFVALVVFSVVSIRILYFRDVTHGPPKVTNGTAVEPNTRIEFPLHFQPTKAPRQQQRLVGCDAWEYRIPIPTTPKVMVGALGLYVDKAEGRRRLSAFSQTNATEADLDVLVELLFHKAMGETLRLVVSGSPPNGKLLEWWEQYTKQLRVRYCGEERAKLEFEHFAEFVGQQRVGKGDELWFERRGEEGQLFGSREALAQGAKPVANGCLARALFEAHFRYQKLGLVNLLSELFRD
ncbi:hypothetical protein BASA81_000137 [Batrachochytrium salamandrivorans]|nr:hypothetical protein BASA81_000137 [Batrachochytrium salamandrivorans]